MTNTQHTPGPWVLKRDAMGRLVIASEAARPRTVGEIADVYRGNPANARLIAAAPKLLAACQRALAEAVADDQDGWYAEVRAAIAEATSR